MEVCCFLIFNHAIPYMLTWIFWKIPSSCSFSFYDPRQVAWGHATNSVGGGGELFSLHIRYHDSTSPPLSLHFFFISFTIHQHFFSNNTLLHFASYAYWHVSYTLQKGFLMHIDSLWFPVSVYIIIAAREHEMKWMLLT